MLSQALCLIDAQAWPAPRLFFEPGRPEEHGQSSVLGRPKALEGALAAPASTVRGGHGCSAVTKLEREPSCGASARPHPCATCTRSPRQEGAAAALYSHVLAEVWASGLSDLVEVEAWHTPTSKLV